MIIYVCGVYLCLVIVEDVRCFWIRVENCYKLFYMLGNNFRYFEGEISFFKYWVKF